MVFSFKAARLWQATFFGIMLLTGIISASTLVVYVIEPEDVADRFSMLFTILLTMVAFQYVVQSSIPSVPYLTFLDKYVS